VDRNGSSRNEAIPWHGSCRSRVRVCRLPSASVGWKMRGWWNLRAARRGTSLHRYLSKVVWHRGGYARTAAR